MTLSSNPCSCQGENPHCFRCWGTGMVELATRPDTGPRGTGIKASKSKRYNPPVKSATSLKNVIRVIDIQPTASLSRLETSLTCPECGCNISSKKGHLEKHLRKVHGPSKVDLPLGQNKYDSPTAADTVSPELHKCSVCGVFVRSLEKHAKRTGHGARAFNPRPSDHRSTLPSTAPARLFQAARPSKSSKVSKALKARPEAPASVMVERSNNLDAKHGWGGSFRDNGQFGSYPSHDAMDDESFS